MAKKEKSSALGETFKTVIFAVALALVIRVFAYEPFNIPSASMVPTLLVGDYLFVSKFSYGYSRFSFPWSLPLFSGRIFSDLPERGDVVVFKLPSDNQTDYIKRVIGLPGDRIQVLNGILRINGQAVQRERVSSPRGAEQGMTEYIETLPNGVSHWIWEEGDNWPNDNTGVFEVPPDHLFVMGDNRDNSMDSRYMNLVGYVPLENLVGRAEMIFFSHDGSASLWEIWRWPGAIRFGRFFDGIG